MSERDQGGSGVGDFYESAKACIGRENSMRLGTVVLRDAQRFAMSVGDLNRLYFDEAYARAAGYPGVIAPPTFLAAVLGWEAGPPESELRADGTDLSDTAFIPLDGARLMGGGQELEFVRPVRPGDEVTMHRRVVDAERRDGRSGPLTLLKTEKRYVNQDGELLLICRETMILR